MANILVTGGCGFLGHNIIPALIGAGHKVVCVDRYEAPFLEQCGADYLNGDISEKTFIAEALRGIDIVIHLACTILPQMSNCDPLFDVMTNVGGTITMLDAAVNAHVGKFIFLSSGGTVYGVPETTPILESHPTNPTCSYGIVKLTIEKYLRLYSRLYGIKTCAVRLSNPYGPHQRIKAAQGVIPVFCYRALCDEAIDVWGDGSVRRDFIYIDDFVSAMIKIVKKSTLPYELNIGSGITMSIKNLLKEISDILDKDLKCNYLDRREFDVPVSMLDISRAECALDWHPAVSIRQGLMKTIAWIRENEIERHR